MMSEELRKYLSINQELKELYEKDPVEFEGKWLTYSHIYDYCMKKYEAPMVHVILSMLGPILYHLPQERLQRLADYIALEFSQHAGDYMSNKKK